MSHTWLRHVVPTGARPLGASLLAVCLILPGAGPWTPGQRGASLLAVLPWEISVPFGIKGSEPLAAIINVRMSIKEKARIVESAEIAGMSVSELARRRCLGRQIVARADLVAIAELNRLGGLIKHLHVSSNGSYAETTEKTLKLLNEAISRLDIKEIGES